MQRQPNRRTASSTPAKVGAEPPRPGTTAQEGVGWGEDSRVPDDWGWGLDNPTLAAATGSYETELQAQHVRNGNTYSPPASDAKDNWDDTELDWDDETAAEGDIPEPSPDVTVLSSREVVSHLLCMQT